MIDFDNLRLFTQQTNSIRFKQNSTNPFILIYFSENSSLIEDYHKLSLKKLDFHFVVTPLTKIPKTILDQNAVKLFKKMGLYNISQKMRVSTNKNFIFDFSAYLNRIQYVYKPLNYRQRVGILIKNTLSSLLAKYPPNYRKILFYSVDIHKEIHPFISRKSYPILQMIKDENTPFDNMILALIGEKDTFYRLLMRDKKTELNRILPLLKNITSIEPDEEKENDVEKATDHVVNKIIDKKLIHSDNKIQLQTTVRNYLNKSPEKLNKVLSNKTSDKEIIDVASASVIHNTNDNISKSDKIIDKVPDNKKENAFKTINKNLIDEVIPKEKTKITSTDVVIKTMDIPKMIDNKSPEHLFKKRAIDFHINLKKDMYNSFDVLRNKEVPLTIESLNIVDKKSRTGEINKSDESLLKVMLKDKFGNKHDITIELPRIDPVSGTFRINGQKKCLVNQIVLCPITFPKPYDSKFESSYSSFHIWSKKTRTTNYLEIYIASYKLPFLILLSYSFGFDKVLKEYGITYKILNSKPKGKEFNCKISSDKYILFENINSELKEEIVNSFIRTKIDKFKINKEFGTNDYFNELIFKLTGKINATYKIRTNLENIVDPVAKQVLINQNLPYDLENIMKYMAPKTVSGYSEPRNNLSNQRIRNSEVLVHLAQKQILAAYTNYKEQVLSGNENAKFQIVPTKVISDFINSEIVVNMEYGNPIEEMATLSKVSPVGKSIGGIPGKEAVQIDYRNVHDSYFGNIDPLDTPEGPNIGIVQQLTVDSYITSARGLIKTKPLNNKESSGILSTSTSMIPFIENNEGARIIMAASQAKQIIPLKNPESPIVQSGYESILTNVLSDNFIKRSPVDGKIMDITYDNIEIKSKDGKKNEVDISPVGLKSGSGKNTLSAFKPIINKNENVKQNQIIAEGSCIHNGTISMGRTLTVGIMPYKGFNYEDGVVLNERLIDEDKLTSLHLIEEDVMISDKDRLLFINDINKMTNRGEPLLRKTIGEIEELIGFEEEEEDSEISGGQFIKKSPGGLIVDIDVFCNVDPNKFPKLKDYINRTNRRFGKPDREKFTIHGKYVEGILVRFKLQQELKIGLGDKLCNRYGNKGIVSLIEKDNLMPRLPWNSERLDFIINPLGILNRMNIGQLYEMYCGLISKKLTSLLLKSKNKNEFIDLVNKVIPLLDKSKNKEYSSKFINNLRVLNNNQFTDLINQIERTKVFPIIIPPFKSPDFRMIKNALDILDLKTKYKLYLPEYGVYTQHDVPVGYMYINKLEHLGEVKLTSRSTGAVTSKTTQPVQGKARSGGQRVGESDSYSFLSYGALLTFNELNTSLSDDHITKNELIADIIQTGHSTYKIPKSNPAKDLLGAYFASLMISG